MVEIKRMQEYNVEILETMRQLLIELSRSKRDRGEISQQWVDDVISSPWHDVLLAMEDGEVLGMASVSVVFGAGIGKNEYLEDFVVRESARGKGVGSKLWRAILEWGREKGCRRLEFTSGKGREAAQTFYLGRGAEIYDTNFFRAIVQ